MVVVEVKLEHGNLNISRITYEMSSMGFVLLLMLVEYVEFVELDKIVACVEFVLGRAVFYLYCYNQVCAMNCLYKKIEGDQYDGYVNEEETLFFKIIMIHFVLMTISYVIGIFYPYF